MKIVDGIKLGFDDVLIKPAKANNAHRSDVVIDRSFQFYHSPRKWGGFPLFVSNMSATGTIAMLCGLMDASVCLHKHYSIEKLANPECSWDTYSLVTNRRGWYSMGVTDGDFEKLDEFLNHRYTVAQPNICLDVANGYTAFFVERLQRLRSLCPESIIMAGNVCTPEMTQELIQAGADIVKVGIGGGSVCTTRLKTGVGVPQLSAVAECAHVAHGLKNGEKKLGLICSDGGCKNTGDICKAFGANADFVMVGGMFAGTDECEGRWKYKDKYVMDWSHGLPSPKLVSTDEKESLEFFGMASQDAADKFYGGMAHYKTAEGKTVTVPYKGRAEEVERDIQGGVRSYLSYVGASCLKDAAKCTQFIRVNNTHNRIFE